MDERASDQQKELLVQIFAGKAGGHPARLGAHIGEVLGVKSVPIEYRREGKRRELRTLSRFFSDWLMPQAPENL